MNLAPDCLHISLKPCDAVTCPCRIAGGVVGCIVTGLFVAFVVYFLLLLARRRRAMAIYQVLCRYLLAPVCVAQSKCSSPGK